MFKLNLRLMTGAALSAVFLAGCGGGNSYTATTEPVVQTVTDVVAYLSKLFNNGENTDPVDANLVILSTNDTAEPAAIQ